MLKRIVWFGSGVASGVVGSWWTKRKVKKQIDRFTTPDGIKAEAAKRVSGVKDRAADHVHSNLGAGKTAVERYRAQARDRFFDRRRRGRIQPVPDQDKLPG